MDLFTFDNLISLCLLILLQAVLGFDNLLYISLEAKSAPEEDQPRVRKIGITIAIGARIALLFILVSMIEMFQAPWFEFHNNVLITGSFNLHSLIVLMGGIFIVYTATKEVIHMMQIEEDEAVIREPKSTKSVIVWIVIMNLVFSFDSILSAMALTDQFWVMAAAIVISGILMIKMSGVVSEFLKKNRLYEVLGLFILFVVGIMLLTEGGHLAHLHLLGNPITPMSKTTFYFVIGILVLTDIVQARYQKRINKEG